MDSIMITNAAMIVLQPYLTKAGEKIAETIGERLTNKVLEKKLWKKIKEIFVEENKTEEFEEIEKKQLANSADIMKIETALAESTKKNPEFNFEIRSLLNLSDTNAYIVEQLVKSIQIDKDNLANYIEERRMAGIETEGQYEIMIARTSRRMKKDEERLMKIISDGGHA